MKKGLKSNELSQLTANRQAWRKLKMDVVVMITEFKNQLKARGYAASTVAIYSQYLSYFMNYLLAHRIDDLKKVSHQVIVAYHAKVMAKPVAMETKALLIRPVKRLFEYLIESHRLLIDPTEGIVETNRKNRKMPPVLTVEEMKKLLEQPNLSLRSQIRDRAMMEVLYCTGIRLDESLSLEVYDVDLKDKALYIRKGKGRRQRVVPLGKTAVAYLKEYLTKIRPHWVKRNRKERKLFLTHSGEPLTGGTVRSFIRRYRIEAGIKKTVSPHTFRRSCATHLVQQGADIRYVQKLLFFNDTATTEIYTRVRPVDVKQTHNRTHPNGKRKKSKGKKTR
jgi:integrase/recombinase XerD